MKKTINLDFFDKIEDFQTVGYYYKSDACATKQFLINIEIKEKGSNCLAKIYEIGIPQKDGKLLNIENGSEIAISEVDYLYEIDIWNKYYFPVFKCGKVDYQWYHDDDARYRNDEIQANADAMKYALKIGLEICEIKTY